MIIPRDEDAAWAEHKRRMAALHSDYARKSVAAQRDLDRNIIKQRNWLQDMLHSLKVARIIDGE